MQEMVFCGTGSFKDVDKEEGAGGGKPAAAAKAKKVCGGKSKGKDNPYASRGLDKFSTVLSELESKREKILRRAGSDVDAGHLMVRFVQSETKGWVPIVVKLPHEEEQAADAKKRQSKPGKPSSRSSSTPPTEPASPREDPTKPAPVAAAAAAAVKAAVPVKKSKAGGVRWSWAWGKKVRPCHYWLLAMALLLLSLVVFGRVFAICCTSIWWYLVPILSGEEAIGAARSPAAKVRDKLAVAPPPSHGKKNSSGAAHEVMSPRSHAHRKKG
ncbi:unnamed protein product [Urochloa decumbens]|uniref:ZCF37 n=1 Tax=Urochloa decumbens TaxID=240449 RepID=A0ABC9ESL9_9POAL